MAMGKAVAVIFGCLLAVFTQTTSANTNYTGSCETPIDVAFLLDSSGSLGRTSYRLLTEAVYNMAKYFGVSSMGSHAAIILYSDSYDISARFDQFMTLGQFKTTTIRLKYLAQRSRMDSALTAAHSEVFTRRGNTRDFLPRIAILFTDGKQSRFTDRIPLPQAAKSLKDKGVKLYVIGIGNGPSQEELESMVDDKVNHVLRVNFFKNLKDQSEDVAEKVCRLFGARKQDASPYPADIGFLFHSADGLSRKDRNKGKQFIASVATTLGIEVPNSRAALMQYRETAGPVVTFSKYTDLEAFFDALYRLPAETGKNQIDVAIREANRQIFSSESRAAVSRVAVILMFGKTYDIEMAKISAVDLHSKGVKLFIVHVGSIEEFDIASLRKLVTNKNNVLNANKIDDLMDLVLPLHDKIVEESVPTAKELSSLPISYSVIRAKWIPAFDPNKVISGYQLSWRVLEDDKGQHVINSPLQLSEILPVNASGYEIKNLTPYTLYKIFLTPQWQAGVRGDIPETQSRTLEDIDECVSDPCDENAECTNTKRSFTCECNNGFSGDGFDCTDIDECETRPCAAAGICTNTVGSFECECENGYSGDGFTCTDIDECLGNPCDENAQCSNNPGSFECKCNTGYSGNGFACTDIDECQGSPCDTNGKCSNSPGSFECECKIGYAGDGFICTDINECLRNPCDVNALCDNTDGSYSCSCKTGYSGDGVFCADNNECDNRPCDSNAKCKNSPGSFSCSCNVGYSGNGFNCEDINECEGDVSPCDVNAQCYNNQGSYYCECNVGYNGNGKVCSAVNICSYPMDLSIAIDTSSSITEDHFEIEKSAVIMLARSFGLSRLGTHVSVIVYGSDATIEINLNDHTDLESFTDAVRKIKYRGGRTRIDKALSEASSVVFTPSGGARDGMPKMLIIMADGQQTSAPDAIPLEEAVAPLASSGVKVVSIGIGHEVDEYELMAISETRKNIYHVKSFDTLFDTITEVGQSLCAKAKKDCKSHADIALLVDSSASMRGGNYLKEKALLKAIGREFDVSVHGSHVGIILYNNDAEVISRFNNKTTLKSFENIVDNLPLKGGKIRLDRALRLAASDVFTKENGMRDQNVQKIMFILTDGTQSRKCDEEALELAIAPLRNEGVYIVAIGVGEADESELRLLVKSPRDLFVGGDFDEVTQPVMSFIKELCKNYDQSCTLGSQLVDFNIDGCISEQPVEVAVCDGKCHSGTYYTRESLFYKSRCSCCLPMIDASKDVILKCPDGTNKLHRITEVSACACRSCGDVPASPPLKENNADTPPV